MGEEEQHAARVYHGRMPAQEFFRTFSSPIGWVAMRATEGHITGIAFAEEEQEATPDAPACLLYCEKQLREYFEGARRSFDDLPLQMRATDFQRRVWEEAMEIPFGLTLSYGQLAVNIGDPDAARAVGGALGRNALAIIVPCHRIVPAESEEAGGFAWGMERKKWLLAHEQA